LRQSLFTAFIVLIAALVIKPPLTINNGAFAPTVLGPSPSPYFPNLPGSLIGAGYFFVYDLKSVSSRGEGGRGNENRYHRGGGGGEAARLLTHIQSYAILYIMKRRLIND